MGFKIILTEVGVKACTLKLDYLKTIQAILKFIEMIIAIVIISTVAYYLNNDNRVSGDLLFVLFIVNFFICIFCLFISEWMVSSAVESNSKSMFEIVFCVVSGILVVASSINLFANNVVERDQSEHGIYPAYATMTVLGILLTVLYSIDITINLCSNCFRKTEKKTQEESLN
ncbi:uncharacterized protein LOC119071965 [Bradysia coprophila]|uniref:uncharacterized protein LOC119071965 n=1 Tax=Bradysia coprophila TaxID=38358 RepID=UPI00187DB942|nr:uncharacterized protein LOC119071965 [Bradysia coprophila]